MDTTPQKVKINRAKVSIFELSSTDLKKVLKRVAFVILFLALFSNSFSRHIVGGDFTYRWLSGNTFELTLKLFRDTSTNPAVAYDDSILVGIFDKVTNLMTDSVYLPLIYTDTLTLSGTRCSLPPEIQVDKGVYQKNVTLANNPNGYYLVWERCCRNGIIVNLLSPSQTGMVFYTEMPDPALHNSSPVFASDPFPFMCQEQLFNYNFAASDPDADQLVYELVDPLAGNTGYPTTPNIQAILPSPLPGPYASVSWSPPYGLNDVCGGSVPLSINSLTGIITVNPGLTGIFAMAVVVHEYRGGIEIGLIRREIEFTVLSCDLLNPAPSGNSTVILQTGIDSLASFPTHNLSYQIYASDSLCFSVKYIDGDSLWLTYSGEMFPGGGGSPPYATTGNSIGVDSVKTNFCWFTSCLQERSTPYYLVYRVKDNGCPIPVTTVDSIKIYVNPVPVIKPPMMICKERITTDQLKVYFADTATEGRFFKRLLIFRSVNGGSFSLMDTINDEAINYFEDTHAFNNLTVNYCYFIRGMNSCGVIGDASDTICTITADNDNVNYIQSVSVANNSIIKMKWEHFPLGPYSKFYIYKSLDQNNFSVFKTLTHSSYDSLIDYSVSVSKQPYCYYMINEDMCGNLSPLSNTACSIWLEGNSQPLQNHLTWTAYHEWKGTVAHYEIWRKNNLENKFSKIAVLPDSILYFTDENLTPDASHFRYIIKAVEDTGSYDAESFSNEIELVQDAVVFIPNSFSPNGDYFNETWGVVSAFVSEFDLTIFNRWGNEIFQSNDVKQVWNGKYGGKVAQQGTYLYLIKYKSFLSDKVFTKTGTITLIR